MEHGPGCSLGVCPCPLGFCTLVAKMGDMPLEREREPTLVGTEGHQPFSRYKREPVVDWYCSVEDERLDYL